MYICIYHQAGDELNAELLEQLEDSRENSLLLVTAAGDIIREREREREREKQSSFGHRCRPNSVRRPIRV